MVNRKSSNFAWIKTAMNSATGLRRKPEVFKSNLIRNTEVRVRETGGIMKAHSSHPISDGSFFSSFFSLTLFY